MEQKNLQDEINKIPFINTDWGLVIIVLLVLIIATLVSNLLSGFWIAVGLALVLMAWKLPTIWTRFKTFVQKVIAMIKKK